MAFSRALTALALLVPMAAALLGVFLLLPAIAALACAIAGLVLFKIGAEFGWKWSTVIGGLLMFSGIFAWAVKVTP